ncbi:MAG: RagB/SusD family nutrient uptake outer membrane protein [Ferruginibacter sp.]
MKKFKYITLLGLLWWTSSCKKFMEPQIDNYVSPDYILQSATDFKGVMYNTYFGIPNRISFTYEAATDNAVTNNENSASSRAARGGVSAQSNPLGDSWGNDYTQINRINWYIDRMVLDFSKGKYPTPVVFNSDSSINMQNFFITLGEAYFLRAWYQFDLLQKYGGVATDGKAYGFPITRKYLQAGDELDLPRNTYQDCANQIGADCDSAAKYLPLLYDKASGTALDGLRSDAGHASGIAAKALKARTYLYGASPAFNTTNDIALWDKAAKAAAEAIAVSNGTTGTGLDDLMTFANYFNKNNLNNSNYTNKDMLFRGRINASVNTYEAENFPPRAGGGKGTFNPSQNLVDAFPMSDGYPRGTSPTKVYDPANVQANRDPRLDLFIVRSGETFANLAINTMPGGLDAYGTDVNATRTGYYLQKLLDPSVRLSSSGSTVTTTFAPILLGKAELYLNFAEAAIRVTGNPDTKIYGYSAGEVLARVRKRALGAGDLYLPTVTGSTDFLNLLLNERRIELCFEDFRFWDLRRLSKGIADLAAINAPVYGIYSADPIEARSFKSPYLPMPSSEILKTKNLSNNVGW